MRDILVVLETDALRTLETEVPSRFKDVLFPNALCYLADKTYDALGGILGCSASWISHIFSSATPPLWAIPRLADALEVSEATLRKSIDKRVWLNAALPKHETQRMSNRAYVYSKFLLQASDFQTDLYAAVERFGSAKVFGEHAGIHRVERMLFPENPRVPLTGVYLKCLCGMGIDEGKFLSQTLRYEQQAIAHHGWQLPDALTDVLSLPMHLFARGIEVKTLHQMFQGTGFKTNTYKKWLETAVMSREWQERLGDALSLSPEAVLQSVQKAQWLRTEMVLFLKGAPDAKRERRTET